MALTQTHCGACGTQKKPDCNTCLNQLCTATNESILPTIECFTYYVVAAKASNTPENSTCVSIKQELTSFLTELANNTDFLTALAANEEFIDLLLNPASPFTTKILANEQSWLTNLKAALALLP